jgi:hypothetical protein
MLAFTQDDILLYIDSIFYASSLRSKVLGGSRIEGRGSRVEGRGSRVEDRGSRIEDRGSHRISWFNLIFNPQSSISMMAPVGFEPTTNGLCLPLRLSPRCRLGRIRVCGLDYLFTLRVCRFVQPISFNDELKLLHHRGNTRYPI